MKKNGISVIAIILSIIAILISALALSKINSIESKLSYTEEQSATVNEEETTNENNNSYHTFDETLVGSWSDTEWNLDILPDSTVLFEQIDYENRDKVSYLHNAPRLQIGYIENDVILISYTANCSKEEYIANPDSVEKTPYNFTIHINREATDSFNLGRTVWTNENYSFRRVVS